MKDLIEYMQSFPDVWFVTNQQLISWVQDPVPVSKMGAKFPCNLPPQDPKNVEVCDGIDNNGDGKVDEGLVQDCQPDSMTSFSSCFGCPVSTPTLSNPVPAVPGGSKTIPNDGCPNRGTWDPAAGVCVTLIRPEVKLAGTGTGGAASGNAATAKGNAGYTLRASGVMVVALLLSLLHLVR
jgi:hypothetical protein